MSPQRLRGAREQHRPRKKLSVTVRDAKPPTLVVRVVSISEAIEGGEGGHASAEGSPR